MAAVQAALREALVVALQYYGGISKMVLDVVNSCAHTVVAITMNHIAEVQMARQDSLPVTCNQLCNKSAD
jgi:hypothetical protein